MKHVGFGSTGLRVSQLCLGTMTFGLQCDERQSHAILDAASAGGIDFLDTADVYPLGGGVDRAGRTEEIVGAWLKDKRHDFVLATKCVGSMGRKPWDQGMSRRHVLDAIEASLRRLGTDYVDLYQFHAYDAHTPLDEALEALDTIVRHGKARYVGVSNWPAYKIARALGRSEIKHLMPLHSVQPRYNLLFRSLERDLLPLCEEEKLAVIPYNPLAGGLHEREFAGAVYRNEQVQLAFGGLDFSDVDVEEADRIGFELPLRRLVAVDIRQPADAMACRQRCSDERVRCGMVGCKCVEAVVERQ